ncbi:site-specific DNA-methyltransferase [Colwellia sp. KU-HH00111]|uniref:DNA-methyltransferase n=1 Tax=Colwellia sp. KU-HH00111 TaxID=3127652 RepID=UPI00310941C1
MLEGNDGYLRLEASSPLFAISNLDAVAWLKQQSSSSIDLVVTDPPYESLEKHRAIGTTTRLKQSKSSSNKWFDIFPNSRFEELLKEIYRVLKNNSHFYLFCDQETAFIIKPIAESVGFKFWKPIVWDKVNIGMGYHYRARYEFILFFEKGKRKINDLSIPDILEVKRIHRGYPTEKPVELSEILICQSTVEKEVVCDPFMGTASVGRAAIKNGRNFTGCDLSESGYKIALNNLEKESKNQRSE